MKNPTPEQDRKPYKRPTIDAHGGLTDLTGDNIIPGGPVSV